MKNLTIVITFSFMLSFPEGNVCSDLLRRSRCHSVKCPPGYGISGPCFLDEYPPVCKACMNGTFSSHSSRSAKCRPCRRCDPEREMVLWQCSPTLDTVCVKFRRLDDDGNEFVVRPQILMEKPLDSSSIANKILQQNAEKKLQQQGLDRLSLENVNSDDGNRVGTSNIDFSTEGRNRSSTFLPGSDIPTSLPETTVAIVHTASKLSSINDQHFTKYLTEHQTIGRIGDHDVHLKLNCCASNQSHRNRAFLIIPTAILIAGLAVLAFLILWRRRTSTAAGEAPAASCLVTFPEVFHKLYKLKEKGKHCGM